MKSYLETLDLMDEYVSEVEQKGVTAAYDDDAIREATILSDIPSESSPYLSVRRILVLTIVLTLTMLFLLHRSYARRKTISDKD